MFCVAFRTRNPLPPARLHNPCNSLINEVFSMKFSFYQPLSGGRPLSGGDSAEASVEAVKDEKMESGAAVEDEVDFDECRDDTSDIEDEEEGFIANEREEEAEKDTQSNGVEEVAGQERLHKGVEDEAIVDASQPDHFVKVKRNGFEVVFDASDCPLERVASNDSLDSNSSIHSTASEISHKLEAIMLDRIAAIDLIRNLLETELENGKICVYNFVQFLWSSDDILHVDATQTMT